MTSEERQELVDRLRTFTEAVEDGTELQIKRPEWVVFNERELFDVLRWLRTFRVKPKPMEEYKIILRSGGALQTISFSDKEEAERYAKRWAGEVIRIVHMREVEE